jgi:hypothetical protein
MRSGSTISHFKSGDSLGGKFSSCVSLHCHSQHSKESLGFIPYYATRIPVVSGFYRREIERYGCENSSGIDFRAAYWTPPLSARSVLESETEQVETRLGLRAIVSLTDHDSIDAAVGLRLIEQYRALPVSFEWTVPFGAGFFHVGVHNLPADVAGDTFDQLNEYTLKPESRRLDDLLAMLNQFGGVLLVLNHPLWDIERIGRVRHLALLGGFLARHGDWIHALEVNGYRAWSENELTIELAGDLGLPVVSGGDRHGRACNTTLNLTGARSFDEFAAEVRRDKHSDVLVMPEYRREHVILRTLETAGDVLRYYPSFPSGRQRWTERIFVQTDSGVPRPLSDFWKRGGPFWVRCALGVMRLLSSTRVRPALRLALRPSEGVAQ